MDKSREEFEEWVKQERPNLFTDKHQNGDYVDRATNNLWQCWQASRSAIVVELPEQMTEVVADTLIHGRVMANDMRTACIKSIRAIGLSIKE
jgi:ethanolamine utilization cobalamin adenosyltransferase